MALESVLSSNSTVGLGLLRKAAWQHRGLAGLSTALLG